MRMNQSSSTGLGPAQRTRLGALAPTVGYYLAFVALGLSTASMGPTLPGLAEQTRTSLGEIGVLFATRSLGYTLGSLAGGRLYDRARGHPVMAGALAVAALLLATVPLVPRLWLLATVLFALGAAEGTLDVGANTLLAWLHRGRVAPLMVGLHFCFGVGTFLAPIVVAQALLHAGGIAWAYWALALAALPVAAYLLRQPSPAAGPAADCTVASPRPDRALLALAAAFLFLYVGAEVGFGGWVYTYATAVGLGVPAVAAYLTAAFWGSFTLGRLVGIPLSARLSPRAMLCADLVGCLASVGVLLAWPHSPAALWLGTLAIGLAMASIFPLTLSWAERRMAISGRVTGWLFVGASAGGMFLPWLMGQAFGPLGPQAAMALVAVSTAAAIVVLVALELAARQWA